jgi:hypothetical protein
MKKVLIALAMVSVMSSAAIAAPIVNVPKTEVTVSQGRTVDGAIKSALEGRGWVIKSESPGRIEAYVAPRTHRADILITYDDHSYAITYVSSSNLDYNEKRQSIHKNYNRWIANLQLDIRARL